MFFENPGLFTFKMFIVINFASDITDFYFKEHVHINAELALDTNCKYNVLDQTLNISTMRKIEKKEQMENNNIKITDFTYDKFDIEEVAKRLHIGEHTHYNTEKPNFYIGGLFDLEGNRKMRLGKSELTAAKIAVDHINKVGFIPNYNLQLLANDSKCDPGVGTDVFYDLIYRNPQIIMMMGSACSEVTETLAEIVPYWNLILVSYASTSPALSEREKYKTFFRLAPTDSANNPARRLFVEHFGWKVVAIIYEDIEIFYLAIDGLSKTLEQHNISISTSISFRSKEGEIPAKIKQLKEEDARIIIGAFSEIAARQVLCEAYKAGMYGPRYVWIIIGEFVEQWWEVVNDTSCSPLQLRQAAEGYFTVASFNALNGKGMSFTNISVEMFVSDYKRLNGTMPMSPYARSAYDTLWTIALTLRTALYQKKTENSSTVVLEQFTYANGKQTTDELFRIMEKLSFKGLSGPVSFKGPDRRGIAVLSQNQGGKMATIAMYEPDKALLKFNCSECVQVLWQEDRVPRDKVVRVLRNKVVEDHVFYIISACSLVGIIASVSFLAFNLYHRKLRYIKLSSPNLNNVALCGCIFVYGGILVLGLDDKRLREELYPAVCTIRAFLFAAGFSLSFGAMFTKTYRVHQIFTRAHNGLVKNKHAIRNVYKAFATSNDDQENAEEQLIKKWDFNESYGHVLNQEVSKNVVKEVMAANPDRWTKVEIEEACKIHWRTLQNKNTREKTPGKVANHRSVVKRNQIVTRLLKDKQLMFIICVLLMLDSTIIVVWVLVDPMNRRIANLTVEPSEVDKDILYIYQLSSCHSRHMDKWMGSFYAVKGLLLVFGVYMAWETRHVKIPVLNDSQYIGLNVYNVVIMSALVVVISNILNDKPTLAYTMESSFVLISTSVTLCLLFGPKVYAILTSNGNPVIASSGILVEDKTRRFVVDEKREKYYRAEVQNRVYKREIVELDQEISRLERLLEMPLQPYPKITEELLYLLPESRVDPSPSMRRRKHKELESQYSISDGGEVCLGLSDDLSTDAGFSGFSASYTIPKIKTQRRMSIVEAATLTAKKFGDFRRSLSFRSPSRRHHQYSGLQTSTSPISPGTKCEDFLSPLSALIRPIERDRKSEKSVVTFVPKTSPNTSLLETDTEYLNFQDDHNAPKNINENHLVIPKWHIEVTPVSEDEENVCISQEPLKPCFIGQESNLNISRKFSKSSDTLCRVTDIDLPQGQGDKPKSRLQTIDTLLSNERRQRIKKLQTDLNKIQRELLDLEELEYTVSKV